MSQFQGAPRPHDTVVYAINISPDKRAMTLILDNLEVELKATGGFDTVVTRTFSLSFPLESIDTGGRYTIDVRGSIVAQDAPNLLVVIQVGGDTWILGRGDVTNKGELNKHIDGQLSGDEMHLNLTIFLLIGSPITGVVEKTRPLNTGETRSFWKKERIGTGVITIDSIDIELLNAQS